MRAGDGERAVSAEQARQGYRASGRVDGCQVVSLHGDQQQLLYSAQDKCKDHMQTSKRRK